jgi:hypothetical protein
MFNEYELYFSIVELDVLTGMGKNIWRLLSLRSFTVYGEAIGNRN